MAGRRYTDDSKDYEEGGGRTLRDLGKRILKVFLVLIVLSGIFIFLMMKVFVVRNVMVEGNSLYGENIIKSAVFNDKYSWNSLYVFLKYRFRETDKIPFVDTMEITMESPGSLKVSVYEKGIMGYLFITGINENAYFDKDGLVVETSSDVVEGVPEIRGIDCDSVVLYEKLPVADGKLRELLILTQTLKRSSLVPDAIAYGGEYEPVVIYGKVKVQIGSTALLTQKVERLAKILPTLEGKKGVLHLESWTENTSNIVFTDKSKSKKNK